MKKDYAIQNLKEAQEHIGEIIEVLEKSLNLEPLKDGYLKAFSIRFIGTSIACGIAGTPHRKLLMMLLRMILTNFANTQRTLMIIEVG